MAARPSGALIGETGVVSVSPNQATSDVFLSPRLIDQNAFDELAGTLRGLIDQAEASMRTLDERLRVLQATGDGPTRAADRLQERLRLSARMLKAFQAQIDRVDGTLEELATRTQASEDERIRLETLLEGFDQSLATRCGDGATAFGRDLDAMATRFEEACRENLPCLETHARAVEAAQTSALARLEEAVRERLDRESQTAMRLQQLEERVTEMARSLEHSEVQTAALTGRVTQARKEAGDAVGLAQHVDTVRAALQSTLDHAQTKSSMLERNSADAADLLDGKLMACERLEKRLTETLEGLATVPATCDQLERLLVQIGPWSTLLIESPSEADGTPAPVARMLERLRETINEDLGHVAGTMRSLADRLDATRPQGTTPPEIVTQPRSRISDPAGEQ